MRHPNAQKGVMTELRSTFPENPDKLPLCFDLVQPTTLPYTMAVFNETLRLYPPVPVELKECTAPTTFPDGTWLAKGSVVIWVIWALGRSKIIWGEDADEFKPERWLVPQNGTGSGILRTVGAFEFPVFNGGPRACLGKKMAELLAVYVIACLIWEFNIEEILDKGGLNGNKKKERQSQNSLTLPMEGGLPCYFRRKEVR